MTEPPGDTTEPPGDTTEPPGTTAEQKEGDAGIGEENMAAGEAAEMFPENQEWTATSTPSQPTPDSQEDVVMIDGVPVLANIEEEEEEEEEVVVEENREELIEQIQFALEKRDRLQGLSSQVQHDIAEYLARKKVYVIPVKSL